MIGQPKHSRKLTLSGVALTTQRNNKHNYLAATTARDTLSTILIETRYFTDAPFSWIGLIVRYGLKNETKPHYQKIDEKDGELPLAIEIDVQSKRYASLEEMTNIFTQTTLIALIHAGKKYDRPVTALEDLMVNYA